MNPLPNGAQTVLIAEDEVNMLHLLENFIPARVQRPHRDQWPGCAGNYRRYKDDIRVVLLDMGL